MSANTWIKRQNRTLNSSNESAAKNDSPRKLSESWTGQVTEGYSAEHEVFGGVKVTAFSS
jgi:hypothetical protein